MAPRRTTRTSAKTGKTVVRSTVSGKFLTKADATRAAKAAKEAFAGKSGKRSSTWKPGGRQWDRFLGHFGIAAK